MQNQNPMDKFLNQLGKQFHEIYSKADSLAKNQLQSYLKQFYSEDDKKRKLLEQDKIKITDYKNWRLNHIMLCKKWESALERIAKVLANSDKQADDEIFKILPEVYKAGRNYGLYEVEKNSGIKTGLKMAYGNFVKSIPKRDTKKPNRDFERNKKRIQSHMMIMIMRFGIPVSAIVGNMDKVTSTNELYANRNAYIIVTGSENAGRMDTWNWLNESGFPLMKTWISRGDTIVRDSHAEINGDCISLDKRFNNGCRFPCDPRAEPEEICNCRCKMIVTIGKINYSRNKINERLKKMSYEEWKNETIGDRLQYD